MARALGSALLTGRDAGSFEDVRHAPPGRRRPAADLRPGPLCGGRPGDRSPAVTFDKDRPACGSPSAVSRSPLTSSSPGRSPGRTSSESTPPTASRSPQPPARRGQGPHRPPDHAPRPLAGLRRPRRGRLLAEQGPVRHVEFVEKPKATRRRRTSPSRTATRRAATVVCEEVCRITISVRPGGYLIDWASELPARGRTSPSATRRRWASASGSPRRSRSRTAGRSSTATARRTRSRSGASRPTGATTAARSTASRWASP